MGKNKRANIFVGIFVAVILLGIMSYAVYRHQRTVKSMKAVEEWAQHFERPWEDMEIKTTEDVMKANMRINQSNLSKEEKQAASIWVFQEYSKNKKDEN